MYFHYLNKYFLGQSIQKDISFYFENRSTGGTYLIVGVELASGSGLDEAVVFQLLHRFSRETLGPEALSLSLKIGQGQTANARDGSCERRVDHFVSDTVGLKDLSAVVA